MTPEDQQKANDELRTTFKGGVVLMTPAVFELSAELRGRMLYRLTLFDHFHPESAHDEGVFVFAGYSFYWRIGDSQEHGRTLTVYLKDDLLV